MLREQYVKYQALEKELENLNEEKAAVEATLTGLKEDVKVPGISLVLFEMQKNPIRNSLSDIGNRVKNNRVVRMSDKTKKRLIDFYLELLSEVEKQIKQIEKEMLNL